MRMGIFGNEKGVALLVVITFATVISLIAAYALRLSYNQARQVNAVSIRRTMINYRAQAGFVDAAWRIRTNTAAPGTPGSFMTPTYDPAPYCIDIDTDAASALVGGNCVAAADVRVDIGSRNATSGLRTIDSTGLDR